MLFAIILFHNNKLIDIYVVDYFRGQVTPMDGAQKILELSDIYHPKFVNIEETGHVMLADYLFRVSKKTGRFLHINTKKAIQKKFYRIIDLSISRCFLFIEIVFYFLLFSFIIFRTY